MKSLQNNFIKLTDKVGINKAVDLCSEMVEKQNIITYEQLEEAIAEELILLEVDEYEAR